MSNLIHHNVKRHSSVFIWSHHSLFILVLFLNTALRPRIKGRKLGYYDENAASQMFPVSKRKVEATLSNLGTDFKYSNTAELGYIGDSKLKLFILYPTNKYPTRS